MSVADAPSSTGRWYVRLLPSGGPPAGAILLACAIVVGLVGIRAADIISRRGADGEPLYWLGMALIFGSGALLMWPPGESRARAVGILLSVGLALYLVKVMQDPGVFTGYDELLHYRTIDDIIRTGRLLEPNPLLTVSPSYPGLELATQAVMSFTGLSILSAGKVVVGIARALFVVSLYLLLRSASLPARLAGVSALLYMASPSFLLFDAQFAYESLALPLAVFCLFVVRQAQYEEGRRRRWMHLVAVAVMLAVIVTHHVTSFILVGTLLLWMLADLAWRGWRRARGHEPAHAVGAPGAAAPRLGVPGAGWLPFVGIATITAWLALIATATLDYLLPELTTGVIQILKIINGESTGRKLFESTVGQTAPLLERLVGIGAVAILVGAIPFGIWYVFRKQRGELLPRMLAAGSLVYPATLLLRFTKGGGWSTASRATAFVYIPLAFTVAAGLLQVTTRWPRLASLRVAVAAVAVLVFAGGVIAGNSRLDRVPGVYRAGAGMASIEQEGVAAATWTRSHLGVGNRVLADSTNALLMASLGRQWSLSDADGVPVSGLMLIPGFGDYHRENLAKSRVDYVVEDRRISGVVPLKGYFYEQWERDVVDYGSVVDTATIAKYDSVPLASRVFDSGSIQIYDVRRLR